MWLALAALRELGGSATVGEMYEQMVRDQGFSEEQQAVLTKDGRTSEINYRLHWARTHLKGIGAIDNSQRGVWSLTDKGKSLTPEQMKQDTKAYRDRITAVRRSKETRRPRAEESDGEEAEAWKDRLVELLLSLSPDDFERLAQRLLQEAGFVNVTVVGKSGDGGIDGMGVQRF